MTTQNRLGGWIGTALLVLAVLLLIAGLLTPWYTLDIKTSASQEQIISFGPITYVTVASPPGAGQASSSYGSSGLPATGGLYVAIAGLLLAAILTSGLAVGLSVRPPPARMRWSVLALGIAGMAAAISSVALLAVAQPLALTSDLQGPASNLAHLIGSGGPTATPWASFTGSSSAITGSETWGPTVGWYLTALGGPLAGAGALIAYATGRPVPAGQGRALARRSGSASP